MRSRKSLRARRVREVAGRRPPGRWCRGRTARLTGAPSCTTQRRIPCHHLLACAGPHQTHPGADRHVHGQPEPWRRDSRASMHR
jgi:hypothetical protein